MASLRKFPGSRYWFACFTDGLGNRRQVSTKQTDRASAQRIALEHARSASIARAGNATEAQMRKILSETLEAVSDGQETLRSTPTREYLIGWLGTKAASPFFSRSTHARYSTTVAQFLGSLKDRADKPLTSLRPADFQRFFDLRATAGVAAGTLDVDMKTLRSAMDRARRKGLIPTNPVEAIELPGRLNQQERELFTEAEIELLLAETRGSEWETAILIGSYTAQRLGDCVSFCWSKIDLVNGTIEVKQGKTAKSIKIPLHRRLLAHLESKAGVDTAADFVTPELAKGRVGGCTGLSKQFAQIMRRAGVDQRTKETASGRKFSARSFHSLRHTANSRLADAGVSQELRMRLTGHRSEKVNDGYTKIGVETLRSAVEKL